MDIGKEKSVFLGIYKYYPSAIKFTFDVENECFVLSKKNPLDHEVATISQMNQQWYAWLACAKSKSQAVPQWISVKDKLPPANMLVLGMSQTRSNIFNVYNVMALDEFEEAEVTHWMLLPDAPQEPTND